MVSEMDIRRVKDYLPDDHEILAEGDPDGAIKARIEANRGRWMLAAAELLEGYAARRAIMIALGSGEASASPDFVEDLRKIAQQLRESDAQESKTPQAYSSEETVNWNPCLDPLSGGSLRGLGSL